MVRTKTLRDKPGGGTERNAERKHRTKVFQHPDGHRTLQAYIAPIHWDNNGVMEDIDFTPKRAGNQWEAQNGPHTINVSNQLPSFTLTGKKIPGTATAVLQGVTGNNAPVVDSTDPLRIKFLYADIFTDIDVEIQLRGPYVFTYTHIKTPTAVHRFDWDIITTGFFAGILQAPRLVDNVGDQYPAQVTTEQHRGNVRRTIVDPAFPVVFTPDMYPLTVY